MGASDNISFWFKHALCLLFVVGLVLLPPASSHAATGAHHVMVHDNTHQQFVEHAQDITSQKNVCSEHLSSADDPDAQSTGKCCNGICLTVALNDEAPAFVSRVSAGTFLLHHDQARSIELTGSIQPPRDLT
ncbi:hypothetical protein [Roseovarius sp. D0-M9]|uniref:hypothetical protein n=1 Tax=Roseovarius sp. D0-M9 TaxID=3127117 RepID=UPI00300FB02D